MTARTLVVGDVHGCAEELGALLREAEPSRVVLVGDLFTKGPDAAGVWDRIREYKAEAVMGNHDAFVLEERAKGKKKRAPAAALDWLEGLPLFLDEGAWLVVHAGLDPHRGIAGTSRDQALTLRRWPDDEDLENPFWWSLWNGPPLVVHGHDAARGLVDRRPHSLGLDTGCVYGGRLTGWLVEEDRLLSVPARRAYRPVG